jgi:hypothetical protein
MRTATLIALLSLAAASPMVARERVPTPPPTVPLGQFMQESQAEIQADLRRGEYQEITKDAEAEVLEALQRMVALTAGARTIHDLTAEGRAQLLTEQELVNTRLTQAAEDSRLVCLREQTVGTHFRKTNCMTVAERRQLREEAKSNLMRSHYLCPSLSDASCSGNFGGDR